MYEIRDDLDGCVSKIKQWVGVVESAEDKIQKRGAARSRFPEILK
jgi:hypothetical protein